MQAMGNLIPKGKHKNNLEALRKEILDDKDVKAFIDDHAEHMSVELIERNMSLFREYILNKNNENRTPKLKFDSGKVYLTYLNSADFEARYLDRVQSGVFYDTATLKHKGVSLDDYEATPENQQFLNYAKNFVKWYQYKDGGKGLWIYGRFGIGKTYLMAGLANDLAKKKGANVHFVAMSQLMDEAYIAMEQDESVQQIVNKLSKAEVLIIDDLGTENPTRYMLKNVLYPIIKYRGEYNKPTFITSNLSKDDYYVQLNNGKEIIRMDIARLQEQLDVLMLEIAMTGQNRRNKA